MSIKSWFSDSDLIFKFTWILWLILVFPNRFERLAIYAQLINYHNINTGQLTWYCSRVGLIRLLLSDNLFLDNGGDCMEFGRLLQLISHQWSIKFDIEFGELIYMKFSRNWPVLIVDQNPSRPPSTRIYTGNYDIQNQKSYNVNCCSVNTI